jgi:hypothetical protein
MPQKYISKYSNGKVVSPAQYITEIICEHKAKIEKKDLHYKFWTTKYWAKFYRDQISSANKLLKDYSPEDIIDALNASQAQKIYSLRAPFLKPIIEKAKETNQSKNKQLSKTFDRTEKTDFRKHIAKQNIISKLEDLEND